MIGTVGLNSASCMGAPRQYWWYTSALPPPCAPVHHHPSPDLPGSHATPPFSPQGPIWDKALSTANIVFTTIFLLEMLAKWVAVGFKAYLQEPWNVFDAVVVVVSVAGVALDFAGLADNVTALPLLRVFRVLRIFRLIPKIRGLRMLVQALTWWVGLSSWFSHAGSSIHVMAQGQE